MFSKLIQSFILLAALCGSYAASSDSGVSSAISRIDLGNNQDIRTVVALGTDSSGHTSYSLALEIPVVTRSVSVATAPDTTITAAATLVEGSTDAHLIEIVTAGSSVVTLNEDCSLNNDSAVCTLVAKNPMTTVSTVMTITPCAYPCVTNVTTVSPSPKNGVGRTDGVLGASVLAVIFAAGMLLA